MSLVDHLLSTRTPLELAKEAVATAKENAALRQRAHELEIELFWMKARERDDVVRLEFMINDECYVYSLTFNSGTRYRLGRLFDEQHQAEWYASPREAIDAQIAIQRGSDDYTYKPCPDCKGLRYK